ncbi:MAG: stage II sporulation protein D [Bacilli bacterium]|nr:stage II sporulation protein D [Bacilli bacterium]
MIKKILLFSCLIIIIPFIIVTIFIRDNEITFNFSKNSVVRVYSEETDSISIVPIEEYVVGVVAGEMPIDFEIEALKAQAVAARSYVMIQMQRNIKKEYDVVDTVKNQVYLDKEYLMTVWKELYIDNINKIKTAVLETKGEYASYNDKVAETLFFSTSPGITENSEDVFTNKIAYLRSVESTWDEISPVYTTNTAYTLEEFYKLLNLDYSKELKIEITSKTSTGRIKKIKINNKELTGSYVCSKLGLRSTFFEIIKEDNKIVIKNKGYGHGVGMSQYGAQGMAKAGYNYEDILKHYYTGIEIKKF